MRQFQGLHYRTRKSWSCERRVVAPVEHVPRGENPRHIVTSVPIQECDGRRLYEKTYCARGHMANGIKEQQLGLFADRKSTRKLEKGTVTFSRSLCSRNRSSAIIVIDENGRIRAELASAPDRSFLQRIGEGKIGYSRVLMPVGPDYILSHFHAYGGPKPPPIDHHGIDDVLIEASSTVHYFHEGEWLRLTGAA